MGQPDPDTDLRDQDLFRTIQAYNSKAGKLLRAGLAYLETSARRKRVRHFQSLRETYWSDLLSSIGKASDFDIK